MAGARHAKRPRGQRRLALAMCLVIIAVALTPAIIWWVGRNLPLYVSSESKLEQWLRVERKDGGLLYARDLDAPFAGVYFSAHHVVSGREWPVLERWSIVVDLSDAWIETGEPEADAAETFLTDAVLRFIGQSPLYSEWADLAEAGGGELVRVDTHARFLCGMYFCWKWTKRTLLFVVPLAALQWFAIAPALRRYRRKRDGLCVVCAYDLTGNASGVCPECGDLLSDQSPAA